MRRGVARCRSPRMCGSSGGHVRSVISESITFIRIYQIRTRSFQSIVCVHEMAHGRNACDLTMIQKRPSRLMSHQSSLWALELDVCMKRMSNLDIR